MKCVLPAFFLMESIAPALPIEDKRAKSVPITSYIN